MNQFNRIFYDDVNKNIYKESSKHTKYETHLRKEIYDYLTDKPKEEIKSCLNILKIISVVIIIFWIFKTFLTIVVPKLGSNTMKVTEKVGAKLSKSKTMQFDCEYTNFLIATVKRILLKNDMR